MSKNNREKKWYEKDDMQDYVIKGTKKPKKPNRKKAQDELDRKRSRVGEKASR